MTSPAVEHFRRDWHEARTSLPGAGTGWIERIRREALDRFCDRGFPTPRDEDWKYTNVRPIERRAFRLDLAGDPEVVRTAVRTVAGRRLAERARAAVLVFVNGRLAPSGSPAGSVEGSGLGAPDGFRVDSLARVLESDPERVAPCLATAADPAHAFAALNRAFLGDGAVLSLARGVRLERPVELVFVANGEAETASHPVVLIRAEPGSAATVIEHHLGAGAGAKLANPCTFVHVGEEARLEHHLLLEEDNTTWHVGGIEARVASGGRFASNAVQLGGRLVRYGIDVSLEGPGARVVLNGLYLPRGRQHVDFHTRVDHREPGGTSEQVYKGLLDGHGRGVFNGRVFVHRDAQQSDASQSNHNLLLSPDAEIDTKPQLEIFADDVKCSHGATVGQLDERAIHYVRSRGLGEEAARALLTYGFAEEVLARMGEPTVRRHVEQGLVGALPSLARLPAMDERLG